jgi:hypothetical protein
MVKICILTDQETDHTYTCIELKGSIAGTHKLTFWLSWKASASIAIKYLRLMDSSRSKIDRENTGCVGATMPE